MLFLFPALGHAMRYVTNDFTTSVLLLCFIFIPFFSFYAPSPLVPVLLHCFIFIPLFPHSVLRFLLLS